MKKLVAMTLIGVDGSIYVRMRERRKKSRGFQLEDLAELTIGVQTGIYGDDYASDAVNEIST